MKILRARWPLTLCVLVAFATAAPARAALIHEFVQGGSVIGSIEFSAASPGTVVAFSYPGPSGTLGLADLCGPGGTGTCSALLPDTSWQIGSLWELNDFVLALDFGEEFQAGSESNVALFFPNPASSGYLGTGGTFDFRFNCGVCESGIRNFIAAQVGVATQAIEVTEPGSVFLLTLGLTLLAAMAGLEARKGQRRGVLARPSTP